MGRDRNRHRNRFRYRTQVKLTPEFCSLTAITNPDADFECDTEDSSRLTARFRWIGLSAPGDPAFDDRHRGATLQFPPFKGSVPAAGEERGAANLRLSLRVQNRKVRP